MLKQTTELVCDSCRKKIKDEEERHTLAYRHDQRTAEGIILRTDSVEVHLHDDCFEKADLSDVLTAAVEAS